MCVGLLSVVSVHIVSFFRSILASPEQIVSASLMKRIVWDLFSTAVYAAYFSLIATTVIWLAMVLGKSIYSALGGGIAQAQEAPPNQIIGGAIGVWAVSFSTLYFGSPDILTRTFWVFCAIAIMLAGYSLFFADWRSGGFLQRFTAPFRVAALKISVAVAVILLFSSLTGASLAKRYMKSGYASLVIEGKEQRVPILDFRNDGVVYIDVDGKISFMPHSKIDRIVFN